MPTPFQRLDEILQTINRPGSFCAAGWSPIPFPGLSIHGFGPVPLPMIPALVPLLEPHAEPAPYGRGGETLVDEEVRRCLQVQPESLDLSATGWSELLADVVRHAAASLGVPGEVHAQLYKLLIYRPGDFFIPHRDTEKAPGMFATLVLALPAVYEGGELLVTHKGETVAMALDRGYSPTSVSWAAFYADCTHQVRPVTSG
jgi:predicted 2-oxoglutarate/Fe(II)-dependent dioxygenase YbiX